MWLLTGNNKERGVHVGGVSGGGQTGRADGQREGARSQQGSGEWREARAD